MSEPQSTPKAETHEVTIKEAIEATIELMEKTCEKPIYKTLLPHIREIKLSGARFLNVKDKIDAAQPKEIPTEVPASDSEAGEGVDP